MIPREIADLLPRLFGQYPFVSVTGPRQSGKTTLCKAVVAATVPAVTARTLVYGGGEAQSWSDVAVVPLRELPATLRRFDSPAL